MDVFAGGALCVHVRIGMDLTASDVGEVGLDVKGESTELLDVDRLASTELVVQVGDQSSPDDLHLSNKMGNWSMS